MKLINLFLISLLPFYAIAGEKYDKILVGEHLISIQWISWENFGTATVTKTEVAGVYKITGIQNNKDNTDYLKIDGTLKPTSERQLTFNGMIETKINFINQGNPCLREGSFTFRVSGQRKYWRLKEMYNPCRKDNLVDYIDIFWKQ